jgi:hypothetical protein
MRKLVVFAKRIFDRLCRHWKSSTEVDYDTYLRERAIEEARERARLRFLYSGRGGLL